VCYDVNTELKGVIIMKRYILILLSLVMIFSICACGEEDTQPKDTPVLQLGEIASTDVAEFSLLQYDMGTKVDIASMTYEKFCYVTEEDSVEYNGKNYSTNKADPGRAYISITFTLENIGKTSLDAKVPFGDSGYSQSPAALIKINYDNGYMFQFDWSHRYNGGTEWDYNNIISLQPLSGVKTYRTYINVPAELINSSKPLVFEVSVPNGDGTFSQFNYVVR